MFFSSILVSNLLYMVELLSTPYDLSEYKNAIVAALYKGTKRYVQSEEAGEKNAETAG